MKLHDIIESKCKRYTAQVVDQIKRFPKEACLSGDDSPLKSTWEEMQFIMQSSTEVYTRQLYESTVRSCCEGLVESLPEDELALLVPYSDGYENLDEDEINEIPLAELASDVLTQEFYERVWRAAEKDELPEEKLMR
jgi:hypothetical protein